MKIKLILLAPLFLLLIGISNNYCQSVKETETKDSLVKVKIVKKEKNLTVQEKINNATKIIDNYYAKEQQIKKIDIELNSLAKKKANYLKKINVKQKIIKKSGEKIKIAKSSVIIHRKNIDVAIKKSKKKDSLKLANDTLLINSKVEDFKSNIAFEDEVIKKLNQEIMIIEKSIVSVNSRLKLLNKKKESINEKSMSSSYKKFKSVSPFFKDSVGEIKFSYKNQSYLGFIADFEKYNILFHFNYRNVKDPKAIKYIQLGKVKSVLEKKEGNFLITYQVSVDIEGSEKPALVADWLTLQLTS